MGAGVQLTSFLLKRLQGMGITSVYIEDGRTEGIIVEDVISQRTRQEALNLVHGTLQDIVAAEKFPKQFQRPLVGRKVRDMFDTILHEMRSNKNFTLNLANIYTTDGFLYHHSVNVAIMSLSIGMAYGLTDKQLIELGVGTLLHDVGKLKIPPEILNKPGRLTNEEFEIIKQHSMWGYQMLNSQDDISSVVAHIALEHHEKVDGTGYPRGLTGREMHTYAKITSVADVYEALTANRCYRQGHLPDHALELLMGSCGSHFDYEIVQLFLRTIAIYPTGMTVTLSTGETAVVAENNPHHPQRPVIRIIKNERGEDEAFPYDINLMEKEYLTKVIVKCEM